MRIGIFGGAFNPVHNGHLHLMESMLSNAGIDRLIIIPTANPPHKTGAELVGREDRINMLSIAVNSSPSVRAKAKISDIEFKLEGKSYTYNTLCELKKIYPDDELILFIGSDQLISFDKWYRYEDILSIASVVAMSRSNADDIEGYLKENKERLYNRVSIINCPPIELSSSQIRQAIKQGEDISSFVPFEEEKYIKDNNLYV